MRTDNDHINVSKQLSEKGFAIVDFLQPEELSAYLEFLDDIYSQLEFKNGIHITMQYSQESIRKKISDFLIDSAAKNLNQLLPDHQIFQASFIIKEALSGENKIFPHQDWTFVSEKSGHRSYTVWVSLNDTDNQSGELEVVPCSHKWSNDIRFTPNEIYHSANFKWFKDDDIKFEKVSVRKGQAVIWDHALIHQSAPNSSLHPRLNFTFAIKNTSDQLKLFWYSPFENQLLEFDVDDNFYNRNNSESLYQYYQSKQYPELLIPVSKQTI